MRVTTRDYPPQPATARRGARRGPALRRYERRGEALEDERETWERVRSGMTLMGVLAVVGAVLAVLVAVLLFLLNLALRRTAGDLPPV